MNPMKSSIVSESVARYVVEKITTDSGVEAKLRTETQKLPNAGMISGADSGRLLSMLVHALQARKVIEIGTFTGYTALMLAQALPEGGKLVCCDINEEWTSIGRKHWREAGVENKIDLRIQPAGHTLEQLVSSGEAGKYDLAFIDADKGGYDSYYEGCLRLLRPGGMIVLDNMLWHGTVADPGDKDTVTVTIRNLNAKIAADKRVESCLLTVGDGMMLVRKR
jgi:predicted O-methyltransferase YrrM